MAKIAYVLYVVGALFILCGIVAGLIQVPELRSNYEDMVFWKEHSTMLSDEMHLMYKQEFQTHLVYLIVSILSGVISGIFFIALGVIIGLLNKIANTYYEVSQINKSPTASI